MTHSQTDRFSGAWSGGLFVWIAAAAVIAIAVIRYCIAPSFWLDEAFVAASIRNRSPEALFAPLEYGQYFPRVYLAAIVLLRELLGYRIWVVRLVPTLSFITGTVLWARLLARRSGGHWAPGALGGALLVGSVLWMEESIQVKQYTLDVMCGLIPFLVDDSFFDRSLARSERGVRIAMPALFAVPALFSYTYPIALGARLLGWYVYRGGRRGRPLNFQAVAALGLALAVTLTSVWLTDYRFNFQNREAYLVYWHSSLLRARFAESAGSGLRLIADFLWGWHAGRLMPLAVLAVAPLQALGLYRVFRTWKRRNDDRGSDGAWGSRTCGSLFLLAGVVLASALVNYPMSAGRLTLFAQVHLQLLVVEGALFVLGIWSNRRLRVLVLLAPILVVAAYSLHGYARFALSEPIENIRPLLPLIHADAAETLWVHPCSAAQVETLPDPIPVPVVLIETKRRRLPPEGKTWILWTDITDDYCHARLEEIRAQAVTWQLVAEGPSRGLALAEFRAASSDR